MSDSVSIRVVVANDADEFACVRINGDVDLEAEQQFASALEDLRSLHCVRLCVDLGGVGFAGTSLLTFLVRVINVVPIDTQVLLCRPGRMTRHLLELSSLDTIAAVCEDLPAVFDVPAATRLRDPQLRDRTVDGRRARGSHPRRTRLPALARLLGWIR